MKFFKKWTYILGFTLGTFSLGLEVPKGCELDRECVRELPGIFCADGTPSYYTIIPRKNSENLLVFMFGGGACWDAVTCSVGMAVNLTRTLPTQDWNSGEGIFNHSDPENPFRDFTVVTIPYCTGDVFVGNSKIDYGKPFSTWELNHKGYENALHTLQAASEIFPDAKKVVLMGTSAGAIGAYTHMRNFDALFPNSQKYVISDAGTPFQTPFVSEETYAKVLRNWNAYKGFPVDDNNRPAENFGAVLEFNRQHFPHIKFGLIHSYSDYVMTGFSVGLGATDYSTAVHDTIIYAADKQIGANTSYQKVFFTESWAHTLTQYSLKSTESMGVRLADWLSGMLNDGKWDNVRPDLEKEIIPWMPFNRPPGAPSPKPFAFY
ncbi:MAG: hypothetical protein EB078_04960 [Proteobacteria bacterium]|nr:hypothetical protein [Pseudomonadota bacterium]NDC25717.1 hypothetical protein [Pseudomonadota bacterium]NDD04234.1 hypothetical protein [Pseudomonadota bacterium]NDG27547.1 hypothetical protein [Pseudomonadota bacterium]